MEDSSDSTSVGRFLTLADTAELLNISVAEAYALVTSGELPAIRLGGGSGSGAGIWRIERAVLEAFITDKYEENRRRGLWAEANLASVIELSDGRSLGS